MTDVYETREIEQDGKRYRVDFIYDLNMGEPWLEHDWHGPVSDWTTRDKRPGELVLSEDGRMKRFYDFAEAVKIAKREGWGFMPYKLETVNHDGGGGTVTAGPFTAYFSENVSVAISALYQAYRDTFPSDGDYYAKAARADFERLKAWCDDGWHWCGVEVTEIRTDPDGYVYDGPSASLWGIESDAGEYFDEVIAELVREVREVREVQP